jgi:L-methionine (R)-S-oxide reductase
MSEQLLISGTSREEQYVSLLQQLKQLIHEEKDVIAILSNVAAALRQHFHFFWVGFYIVKDEQLVLGPFKGDIACFRIEFGKGVCGTAWKMRQVQLVPNVEDFPGHIACSAASKSEIVVPIFSSKNKDQVVAVLDIDSDELDDFNASDTFYLTQLTQWLSTYF